MQDSLFAHPRRRLIEVLPVYDSAMPTALIKVPQWPCGIYPRKAQSLISSDTERGYAVLKPLVNPVKAAPVGFQLSRTQKASASDVPLALIWV